MSDHKLVIVGGGPECNYTLWQCTVCFATGQDIHEWEGGHERESVIHNRPCQGPKSVPEAVQNAG